MKKNYALLLLTLVCGFMNAQITPTTYRGAFAPAPAAMWTDSWTNFDPQNAIYPAANVTVNSAITTNTTWTANNTYLLSGLVYVKNDATLTIEAGTKILGDNTGSALVITKGAKLNAIGTAANPIVFTSDKAVGARAKGDWGGIILLGKGSLNINNGVNNIEGITSSADTQFGGGLTPDDNDNSGTLKYIRIEFGGYVFASNSEINGLTMGAVGRGTTIDYVQVSHINDDGFEWFGGSVDCTHLVSFRTLDDDFDTDNGFNGRVQFALAVRDPQVADAPAISTSEGFECDNNNPGNTNAPRTSAIFSNVTMVGPSFRNTGTIAAGYRRVARLRKASEMKIYNSVFTDFQEGLHIDGVACENAAVAGDLRWKNNIMAGIVSKTLQITSPGTITAGNNANFNLTTWYAANGNTTLTNNSGLMTLPYNNSNLGSYTGLDYRPAANSPLLSGSDFSDSFFSGLLAAVEPTVVSPVNYCRTDVAVPLSATLFYGTELKWYTVATGGTASSTAPTPLTTVAGTKNYYVSQVVNGVESPRALIVVNVYSLPTAPVAITGESQVCGYVGTERTTTYSIAAVAGAATYQWTLPTGMNLVSTSADGLTITVNFANVAGGTGTLGQIFVKSVSANGCLSSARTYTLYKNIYVPGSISGITSIGDYVGNTAQVTYTIAALPTAQSYLWETPAGVNIVSGQGTTSVVVNFQNASTSLGTLGNISVKSVSPCGTSGAKTLSLVKELPTKPASLTTSLTNVCSVVGTQTNITYTCAAVPNISTYAWTIPTGGTIIGANNGTSIVVNYASFPNSSKVSAFAVSAVGSSTARELTITKLLPGITPSVSGPKTGLCAGESYTYTFPAVGSAQSYRINAPVGAVVTSPNFPNNTTNVLATTETTFSVVYPVTFVTDFVRVFSINNCATSSSSRALEVTKTPATPGVISGPTSITCAQLGQQVTYTVAAMAGAVNYIWEIPTGATVVSGQGTNSLTLTFSSAMLTSTSLYVSYSNTCGTVSNRRKLTITEVPCLGRPANTVEYSELYPNPSSSNFNIDINAAAASELTVVVYAFNGNVVSEEKHNLQKGNNTVNTNTSRLPKGLYVVRFINPTTNSVETKKFFKN